MASAWGSSWGQAWGNAWGSIVSAVQGGGFSRSRNSPQIVVVSVDGQDYRVSIYTLQAFLDALKKDVQTSEVVKRKVQKIRKAKSPVVEAPRIVVKSAPVEYLPMVQQQVDRSNEIMAVLWLKAIERALLELDDEETLMLLLA